MQKKVAQRIHKERTKHIFSFDGKKLRSMIDRIAITEDLDVILDDVTEARCLHIACALNEDKLSEALLTQGADPEVRDRHGNTPFHYAMAFGHNACIQVLRSAEVDEGVTNVFNATAADLAQMRENEFIVSRDEESAEDDAKPLINRHGKLSSGLSLPEEDCIRVLLTRIFGVPAKPLEYPSETERLLNISHTKMRPIPLDRLPPENILEVEDPTEGPLWDWVCYQLWRLLRVEVEDSGPVKLWIK
mmetsp:Transcript_14441/g.20171  ORF Transcript_14441/g.20171 Transcript_14441/m.20171 type:complete len:246 (+) Transcript_14441:73-810(+)